MIVGFREGSSDVLDSTESLAVVLLVFLIEYLIFKMVSLCLWLRNWILRGFQLGEVLKGSGHEEPLPEHWEKFII